MCVSDCWIDKELAMKAMDTCTRTPIPTPDNSTTVFPFKEQNGKNFGSISWNKNGYFEKLVISNHKVRELGLKGGNRGRVFEVRLGWKRIRVNSTFSQKITLAQFFSSSLQRCCHETKK